MPLRLIDIVKSFEALGGETHLNEVYNYLERTVPEQLSGNWKSNIRARLQEHCSESSQYKGTDDLFYSVFGVLSRRGYWGLKSMASFSTKGGDKFYDEAEVGLAITEGALKLRSHLTRERSRTLIERFKASLDRYECQVCEFDFEKVYGKLGTKFIEAHHTIPVSKLRIGQKTKITDLIAVCSNCHRIIHRNNLLDWKILKKNVVKPILS